MTAETSNARGEVVAWFPTYEKGDLVRNYGDGSPVYASKTKEEAEQAKRCHLGATGPVIPLYAAPPPSVSEALRLLRDYRMAPKFSNDHDAIKRTVALEDEIDAFLAAAPGAKGVGR